jgi:hypothetical protein
MVFLKSFLLALCIEHISSCGSTMSAARCHPWDLSSDANGTLEHWGKCSSPLPSPSFWHVLRRCCGTSDRNASTIPLAVTFTNESWQKLSLSDRRISRRLVWRKAQKAAMLIGMYLVIQALWNVGLCKTLTSSAQPTGIEMYVKNPLDFHWVIAPLS